MIPDSFKKTIQIPFRVVNGKYKFFYGGELPKLKEGTLGELIIREYSVTDERKLELISQEFEQDFLPEGTCLWARFSKRSDNQSGLLKKLEKIGYQEDLFAEIVLAEPLKIKFRGTKKPELMDCECRIPSLSNIEAMSLNHAYTLISEKFETHRRTHTGNIYAEIYFLSSEEKLRPLDYLRSKFYRDFEYQLSILCSNQWWFKKPQTQFEKELTWAYLEQKEKEIFIAYCIKPNSRIISENYFTDQAKSIAWLNSNRFEKFDSIKTPQEIIQPYPPYKKTNGEDIQFSINYNEG